MKFFGLSIFVIVCISSCTKPPDVNPPLKFPRIDSVKGAYLINREQHNAEYYIGAFEGRWSTFQFNGNKIVKRIGGIVTSYFSTATDLISDTVIYNSKEDTIILKTINRADYYNIPENPRMIVLKDGRIVRKITYNTRLYNESVDTINYFYDGSGKLERTLQHTGYTITERFYAYEGKGNLLKITQNITNTFYPNRQPYTTYETFGGYDNTPNPLKGICLWQDLLYRTLSSNNFTTYSSRDPSAYPWPEIYYTLEYDANGIVDYAKPF